MISDCIEVAARSSKLCVGSSFGTNRPSRFCKSKHGDVNKRRRCLDFSASESQQTFPPSARTPASAAVSRGASSKQQHLQGICFNVVPTTHDAHAHAAGVLLMSTRMSVLHPPKHLLINCDWPLEGRGDMS